MKNEIENIFKERFDDYETAPSEGLFSKIQAKREKKRRVIWIWSAAGICLLAVLSVGIANYTSVNDKNNEISNTTDLTSPNKANNNETLKDATAVLKENHKEKAERQDAPKSVKLVDKSLSSHKLKHEYKNTPNQIAEGPAPIINKQKSSKEERAILYAQLVQQREANNGEGKFFIRGTQKGNKNPFDRREKSDKKTKTGDEIKDLNKKATPDTEDEYNKTVAANNAVPKTVELERKTELDTSTASSPFPTPSLAPLSKWQIEVSAATGYAYRRLDGKNDDVSARNKTENGKISYAFQLNTMYQFAPKWNAQIGLDYTARRESFSQNIAEQDVYTSRMETRERLVIHPVLGERIEQYEVQVTDTQTTPAYTTSYDNSFSSISIPLALEYTILTKGKWKINTKLGMDATIYKKADGLAIAENVVREYSSIPYLRGNTIRSRIGIGVAYRASDMISLVAYPQMTYQLSSGLASNAGYEQRDYTIFSHFGLRIRL